MSSFESELIELDQFSIYEFIIILKSKELFNQIVEKGNPGKSNGISFMQSLLSNFLDGNYIEVIKYFDQTSLSLNNLLESCLKQNVFSEFRAQICLYLENMGSKNCFIDTLVLLLLAISYFEIYCQSNYTGPELSQSLIDLFQSDKYKKPSIHQLECDGNYPYVIAELPQTLLIARSILSLIYKPELSIWKNGIFLDDNGMIHQKLDEDQSYFNVMNSFLSKKLLTLNIWNTRANLIHYRLLQSSSFEDTITLWKESQELFKNIENNFGDMSSNLILIFLQKIRSIESNYLNGSILLKESDIRIFFSMLALERGLALHYYSFGDKGKSFFSKAKDVANLTLKIDASLGRRMKYQREDIAQLFLYAKSGLVDEPKPQVSVRLNDANRKENNRKLKKKSSQVENGEIEKVKEEDGDLDWELGRRMIKEAEDGEEAALREVLLEDVDGGREEVMILEGGPKFTQAGLDKGGILHPMDQSIILALCLDVANSNPKDGLTNEEMQPYIERVLEQANNWMIHSTALLERSWIEFERRKTMDRAMLQIQALIDQHTTKLTIMQSSYDAIADSAKVNERMTFLYDIVYPAQYELKKDLAQRYLQCQVFVSALNYFRELEMWDEVVACYQLLQKPHRAEMVVRERLKDGETPYMLTALADVTGKEEFYEKAWVLSNGRYPRAKRTLAKICFNRGEFEKCRIHMQDALAVQPLNVSAWYIKGLACMNLEYWEEGVQSFVRCTQQEPEMGEAWANIGAIYMKQKEWTKSHQALTEALKQKRESWQIIENLINVCLCLKRYKEVVYFMNKLLDLRLSSKTNIQIKELKYLSLIVSSKYAELHQQDDSTENKMDAVDRNSEIEKLNGLISSIEKLFQRISVEIKSDLNIWDIFAQFYHNLGNREKEADSRVKQFRAIISTPSWIKNSALLNSLLDVSKELVEAHLYRGVKKTDIYSCKMLLQSTVRKIEKDLPGYEKITNLKSLVERLEVYYNELI